MYIKTKTHLDGPVYLAVSVAECCSGKGVAHLRVTARVVSDVSNGNIKVF